MMLVTVEDNDWDANTYIAFDVQTVPSETGLSLLMTDNQTRPIVLYAPGAWMTVKVEHDYEVPSETETTPPPAEDLTMSPEEAKMYGTTRE